MEVEIIEKTKDSIEFRIKENDLSLPNLLVSALNKNDKVEFSAYKRDHPLVSYPTIYVKTMGADPVKLLNSTIDKLVEDVEELRKNFQKSSKETKG